MSQEHRGATPPVRCPVEGCGLYHGERTHEEWANRHIVAQGYYFKIDRGQGVKTADGQSHKYPGGGIAYNGGLTKAQYEGLDRVIGDYLDGKTTRSETVVPKASRQYYYRVNGCKAAVATATDCICWHDEGAGPLSIEEQNVDYRTWRETPLSATASNLDAQRYEVLRRWLTTEDYFIAGMPQADTAAEVDSLCDLEIAKQLYPDSTRTTKRAKEKREGTKRP